MPLNLPVTIQDYWNLIGIVIAISWTPGLAAILCLIIVRRLHGHHLSTISLSRRFA